MPQKRHDTPVTAKDVEEMLDKLAWIMAKSRFAHLGPPLWRRLEAELAELQDAQAIIDTARERFRRSQDQTEARSS